MLKLGFLGLGAIGRPIAERLVGAYSSLAVFDPRAEAIAQFESIAEIATSAKDVGDRADVVFGCLVLADAHRSALLGASGLIHGSRVRTYVHLGTTGPTLVQELGAALQERQIATVDVPITGGVGRACNGTLTAMASGNEYAFAQVKPLIGRFASKVVWLGDELGNAQVMKLVNNAVSLANLAAACEAMIVGAKAGLKPADMLEVLNSGSGQNSATLTKIPSDILTGSFNVGGSLEVVVKDYQAFLEEAARLGIETDIGRAICRSYIAARDLATEHGDVTEVIRPMEAAAGMTLRHAVGATDAGSTSAQEASSVRNESSALRGAT